MAKSSLVRKEWCTLRVWGFPVPFSSGPHVKEYRPHCQGRVPGASVRNPTRDKVMRKEADIRKACSDFRGPSGNS